jgi:hypothetical protein
MSAVTRTVSRASRRLAVMPAARVRTATLTVTVLGTAVLGALITDAAPTGLTGVDEVWAGGLVAAVAYLSATARRWTWFPPAGVAAVLSGGTWATAIAGVAVLVGFYSVLTDTRTRARGALAGGLGAAAMLGAGDVGFHGLTAIATVASVLPACVSGYRFANRRARSRIRMVAGTVGVAALLLCAGALVGLVSVSSDLAEGARLVDDGLAAAREADDDRAGADLAQAARHLASADVTLSSWFVEPARLLPAIGPNIDAVETLAEESTRVATVTSVAADEADVDSLRFIGGRIDPQAVADMEEPVVDSMEAVEGLADTVDEVQLSPWLVSPLADRIDRLSGQVDEAVPDGEAAVAAIRNAPWMLGVDAPRRYLVLFTTPVEARGRSGFPGNYAELVIDDGQLSMPRFGRISELEQGGVPGPQRTLTEPPDLVRRYERFDVRTTWRNLTMSPDMPSIAVAAQQLYPQSGGAPIDGVIAIDPTGLAGLLRYTGEVEVPGLATPLDEDNAAEFLQFQQYVQFPEVSERVDLLETVARTTFERLTSADLPSPRALAESLDPLVDGGHIQFAPYDIETFLYADTLGLAGRLGDFTGDALAVTTNNAAGSKIDLFLRRETTYDVSWDPATGATTGTVRVALTNESPASGLPDYVIGNFVGLPTGTNRTYLSVYSPLDLTGARIDGQPATLGSEVELERNVYSTFVDIPPGATVTVELDVTGTAVAGPMYVLDLAQQPLVMPEQFTLNVTAAGDLGIAGAVGNAADDELARLDIDGRQVHWQGPLDRRMTVMMAASDDAEAMQAVVDAQLAGEPPPGEEED